jgi:YfiH family protein
LSGGLDAASPPWASALASVGAAAHRLMRVRQVHGASVRSLRRGAVGADAAAARPDGDAIVSNEPGLALAVLVADCVPILLADARTGSAAAVHAGWRGTCAGVAGAAVEAMRREFAVDPGSLLAAIGPSIGPEDYEVGEEVRAAFAGAGHPPRDLDRWFRRHDGRLWLDLWAANRDQFTAAGLAPDRIYTAGLSTLRHRGLLASYRADREKAGRMAALIVVPLRSGA